MITMLHLIHALALTVSRNVSCYNGILIIGEAVVITTSLLGSDVAEMTLPDCPVLAMLMNTWTS